jgi:hypothetical protein
MALEIVVFAMRAEWWHLGATAAGLGNNAEGHHRGRLVQANRVHSAP